MYNVFLGLLMFVSVILIFLIIVQKDYNLNSSYSSSHVEKLFTCLKRNKHIVYITIIFATLFFLINLVLCNFHGHH
ncbi:preprotein translocase subunit SecG [Buchnera aphidicola (Formosaphis micheliae)]|uniref:preprotein translocase subunit SecG n=1 Tax=Buchnera aphidicola TaxID=9 RepID=UPI0031B88068